MISRNRNFEETEYPNQIILETVCPFCGKKQKLTLVGDKAIAYKKGKVAYEAGYRIQDAFSSFTPVEREFIFTGICPECWNDI